MPQVCRQCSRANPPDATYCYWDGAMLGGQAGSGPVNLGAQLFPSPFVFPNGQQCRNFDQLATACQQNWSQAVDLLKQGFLSGFLGGLGRIDLAQAAQEAARFPDVDRGFDQLLSKLPTHVLQPPKLKVEPSEISLGQVALGTDRTMELHLSNQGMRLLYGSVVSDSKWLTLGEGPGSAQRIFQFGAEMTIPVQIRGQHLRAGAKPLEGNLIIESNGGQANLLVRADVPAKPFPDGVLAGAISPRQIAEKAKAAAQVSVPLFESGAVSRWFTDNGWQYPVQGPTAAGLGAVQQFFEALGLAKPPKLELKNTSLNLKGQVGQMLHAEVEVFSNEKRPVYAYGTVDQPWLDVSHPKLSGRRAAIPVQIHVPNRPGETLQANIRLMGNGNQKFTVPVSLTVEGSPFAFGGGGPGGHEDFVPLTAAEPVAAAPFVPVMAAEPMVRAVAAAPYVPVMAGSDEIVETTAAGSLSAVPVAGMPSSVPVAAYAPVQAVPAQAVSAEPFVAMLPGDPFAATEAAPLPRRPRREGTPLWMHLLPLGILGLALLVVMIRDLFGSKKSPESADLPIDPKPRIGVLFDLSDWEFKGADKAFNTATFGVYKLDDKEVNRLTFHERGRTNSTMVRIDNRPSIFGRIEGVTEEKATLFWKKEGDGSVPSELLNRKKGLRWRWRSQKSFIEVTQRVELVPGEPVEFEDGYKRQIDTCLVHYRLENKDDKIHTVGLRFILDTLIGENDQPFFSVPGTGLVNTCQDFKGKIPDFVQALEKPDIKDPGIVAQLNLRLSDKLETPDRVSLTRWPGSDKIERDYDIFVPQLDPKDPKKKADFAHDSAVVIYWEEKAMKPKDVREMGFTYGLGDIKSKTGISLTVRGDFSLGGDLTVVALVNNPKIGETLTLGLPEKLTLLKGDKKQSVPLGEEGRPGSVTWTIRSTSEGLFDLEVKSSSDKSKKQKIRIRSASLF